MRFNKPLSFLLTISFLIFLTPAFAQFPGMGAIRTQMDRQYMNQQFTMFNQMNMLHKTNVVYNEKQDFLVTMLDGSQKIVRSKILIDSVNHKNYLEFVDKKLKLMDTNRVKKIYPSQTLSIGRDINVVVNIDDDDKPIYITGLPKDSCWMFKAVKGTISAYSYLSEIEGRMFIPFTIVGIQYNEGPIISFNKKNLSAMVKDNPNALDFIKDNDYYGAIKRYNKDVAKETKKAAH